MLPDNGVISSDPQAIRHEVNFCISWDLQALNFDFAAIPIIQASYGKGPDYFLLKTEIFSISVFLLLFSMKFHSELENDQPDSFQ